MRFSIGLGFFMVLVLAACSDKGDDQAPVIGVDFVFPDPVEREVCEVLEPAVYVLRDDQTLSVDLQLSDNEALGQLKIDIHANFDCHGHGGVGTIGRPPGQNATTDWRVLDIRDLSGRSVTEPVRLDPPGFATAGPYHLSFQVLDESGNETDPEYFILYLYNHLDTIDPVLSVTEPVNADLGSVSKGTNVRFSGTITDNRSLLDGGNGVVYLVYQDLGSGNYFQGPYQRLETGDEKSIDYTIDFTVPSTLVSGDYRIFLRGVDGVNNLSQEEVFTFRIP